MEPNAKEFFIEFLRNLCNHEAGVLIYLVTDRGIFKANIINEYETELVVELKGNLKKLIKRLESEDFSVMDFLEADDRKDVVYYCDIDVPLKFNNAIKTLTEIERPEYYQGDFTDIDGVIYHFGTEDNNAYIYREFYSVNLYQGRKRWIFWYHDDQLKRFDRNLLQLDCGVDCVYVESERKVFVSALNLLNASNVMVEYYTNKSTESINRLASLNLLEGMDFLVRAMQVDKYQKKLILAMKNPNILNLTPVELRTFVESIPKLRDKFSFSNDNVFTSNLY